MPRRPAIQVDEKPRLIEWTGERCVPWSEDVQVVYEHLHRYSFAAGFVAGKRVLDLGSGEGYGTAMLAETASAVYGLDIDEDSVAHARHRYDLANAQFIEGSAVGLEKHFGQNTFDVVVCFEVIEHVTEHQLVLDGVDHVLEDGGILVISTPDRALYAAASTEPNPFHKWELSRDEFKTMLDARFEHVALWGQTAMAGSYSRRFDDEGRTEEPQEFFIEGIDDDWRRIGEPRLQYMIAVASNTQLPRSPLPTVSILMDSNLEVARRLRHRVRLEEQAKRSEAEAATAFEAELGPTRAELESTRAELGTTHAELESTRAELAQVRRTLEARLEATHLREAEFRQAVFDLNAELLRKDQELATLDADLTHSRARLEERDAEIAAISPHATEYTRILETRSFRAVRRWWALKARIRRQS